MSSLGPVVIEAFAVWVHDDGDQILHVSYFKISVQADFSQWSEAATARGCRRIELQHFIMGFFLPPSSSQCPKFALHVMNDRRMRPRQQRWDDQAHAFAASGRGNGGNMLRAVVAEIMNFA